jgi:hypothetical protein
MSRDPVSGARLEAAISAAVTQVVEREALHIKREAVKNAPRLTGMMRRSARVETHTGSRGASASVSFNTPYAHYQHEGISRFSGRPLQYGRRSDGRGAITDGRIGAKFLERAINDASAHARLRRELAAAVERAIRSAS